MPGLLKQFGNGPPVTGAVGSPCTAGVWSKRRDEITFDQLQKLWSRLPLEARHMLLRIDKQTLFEQARKNLYCSRCNGLLLEGFSQIIIYGKSFQQEGSIMDSPNVVGPFKSEYNCESIDLNDPLAHPWGGLATTRDGTLTLLDCFINAKSLKALQNIFDNARARERERELLYPDACGGNGRGWISQGVASYGRVHGIRESCALHTARLSCDTLVGFWSALSNDTRSSLLRMKEEDFIERLMYRFDNKRFCRDCRRNVIREFKELKELKRMRRETRCSSWFCVADTAFQYEVLEDTVHADWRQSFADTVGTHHFEWAIGTEEGKSDILSFEDVGMNGKVQVNGLDLVGLSECFITLRACKFDGRCTELCVKAHALKGQPCVHRRLIIGDGFVTITKGESIEGFFEHAEEAEEEEEEEDDDAMDKDGNEFDSDGALPQKHAKSPELAREFLLDAATVIFKEQVEKAFREATARQNAHSIFVCLALKLLEERIHVACKEIITLEKQNKLLEEEEREKREEEERKERRRIKEREKKLRKKERLKEKERDSEGPISLQFPLPTSNNNTSSTRDDSPNSPNSGDSASDPGEISMLASPTSPDGTVEQFDVCLDTNNLDSNSLWHEYRVDGDINSQDSSGNFELEQSKLTRRELRFKEVEILEQASKSYDKYYSVINDASSAQYDGAHRPSRERFGRASHRDCSLKFSNKFHSSNSQTRDRYDFHSCSCNQQGDRRAKDGYSNSTIRSGSKNNTSSHKTEPSMDIARPLFRSSMYNHGGKLAAGVFSRDVVHTKQVWEPLDSRKKRTGSKNDLDFTKKGSVKPHLSQDAGLDKDEDGCELPRTTLVASGDHHHSTKFSSDSFEPNALTNHQDTIEDLKQNMSNAAELEADSPPITGCEHLPSSSSSDNCSSCLSSEMDSSSSSSLSTKKAGSSSTSSDSEDTHAMHVSACNGNPCDTFKDEASGAKTNGEACCTRTPTVFPDEGPTCILPLYNQSMCVPVFLSPDMRYRDQAAVSWAAAAAPTTGLLPFPQPSHFFFPTAFGYTLPHMQYTTLQHLAPPVLSVEHHPFFDSSKERVKNPNASTAAPQIKGAPNPPTGSWCPPERPSPNRHLPSKQSSAQDNGSVGIAAKPKKDAPFFSLFHFGGPLLEPTRNVVNPVPLKEENTGDRSVSSLPTSMSCSKEETTVEEYSLFATSNSARFSFF